MQQELTATPLAPAQITPAARVQEPPIDECETVIAPSRGWIGVNWAELFRSRELLYFLVWRDIKVRYKQAVLGAAWAILQPLFNMLMFTLVFGVAANFSSRLGPWGHRYALFVFAAALPWQLFVTSLTSGGMSLVSQQHLLTKIYFPRLYVPTSVVGGALFDLAISFLIVIALMAWYHVLPSAWIFLLPLVLGLTLACSLGAAYLFSALTITYRDFRFLIPFIGQVWMYASFVAFPPSVIGSVGHRFRLVLALNPMYGIITAWRKLLLGGAPDYVTGWDPLCIATSAVITIGFFLLGAFYFRKTERRFADIA